MIYSKYPLKVGQEVEPFPPIQNTANPYLTEAAMYADQANQLQGYGYLVDGIGAFTYLGTVAETAADYEGFGGGVDLTGELKFNNYPNTRNDGQLAVNKILSTDVNGNLKMYSTAIAPAPFLDEVIPDSYLPNTTGMFKLKGSFFTENMTVTTTGGTVNYITFNNDNDADVNITTGATEGSFSVTIDNGISKTFNGVLLIIQGTVYKPITTDYSELIGNPDTSDDGEIKISIYGTTTRAVWNKPLPFNVDWSIVWKYKMSPLGSGDINSSMSIYFINITDLTNKGEFILRRFNETTWGLVAGFETSLVNRTTFSFDEVEAKEFKVSNISGVLYFYEENIEKTYSSFPLTEDLKIEFNLKYQDIVGIKYIETV